MWFGIVYKEPKCNIDTGDKCGVLVGRDLQVREVTSLNPTPAFGRWGLARKRYSYFF